MLKKQAVIASITLSLIFIGSFFYYYRKSGKFRKSVKSASLAALIFLSFSPESQAKSADAFNNQQQQRTRSSRDSGIFNRKSSSDSGSGPGKQNGSDDSGMPKFSQIESVDQTKARLDNIDQYINNMEESSDSETEQNQCSIKPPGKFEVDFDFELDKNGNPTLIIPMKDGGIRRIEFGQTRDKYYHEDLFPNISAPDGFDNQAVQDLKHSDRLAYLRENIPDESVIELQNEIGRSLSHPKNISVPGFLGKYKTEGTIDINMQSGLVSFTDYGTNKHRTIVKMSPDRIQELAKDGFHLFPEK